MATTDTEQLVLQMSADMTRLNRNVVAGQRAFDRQLTALERRAQAADRNLTRTMGRAGQNMSNALKGSLTSIAPTLATAFSTAQIIAYADAWTMGANTLAGAGVATDDLASRQERLVDIANGSRTSTEATVALYSRLSIASSELGLSLAETERITELLNKTFAASGASTQEAASAALQLSQALASGVLQGDELRSLRENAPQLAKAIANSMGVNIGALKKLGAEGKITAQVVADAILKAGDDIEAKFAATNATVGQSLTVLNNELGKYIGQSDSGLSATGRLAQGIIGLSQNLDVVAQVVGVLAAIMGTRFILSMTAGSGAMIAQTIAAARLIQFQTAMTASMTGQAVAMVTATNATRAFTAALAANPLGFVLVAVTALATGLLFLSSTYSSTAVAARELDAVTSAADTATANYAQAVLAARNASAEESAQLRQKAADLRAVTLARIADARVAAQRRVDEAVISRQRADRTAEEANARYANPNRSFSNASTALDVGTSARARADERRAQRDKEEADTAQAAVRRLEEGLRVAEAPSVRTPAPVAPAKAPKGGAGSRAPTGPTEEELEAMRLMLRLQAELEVHRAAGRTAEADAIQRQIDVINLTKTYEDAKVPNAQAEAEAQVKRVDAAERFHKLQEEAAQNATELAQALEEADRRRADLAMDRLGYEAELARLSGDPARMDAAERELFIAERVNELLRLRPELTQAAATAQAGREYGELDDAERAGKLRDEFRDSFRDGIKAAIEGDLGGFFESMADRFTDRMLDNLADNLFDLLSQAAKGMSGGGGGASGGWIAALASAFAPRATGGPVTAGSAYLVGERRPEVFVPNVNGTVIPNVNAAMGRMDQAQARAQQAIAVRIDVNDDRFNAYVDGRASTLAVQSTAAGVAYSQDQARTAGRRRRQSLI